MQGKQFYDSLGNHQIKPRNGWALLVELLGSDNKAIKYPAIGVLVCFEQGVGLQISQAIFHIQKPDGSLGAPITARRPRFIFAER